MGVLMGEIRVTIDVNVPKDVLLKIMSKVSRKFFENVQNIRNGIELAR